MDSFPQPLGLTKKRYDDRDKDNRPYIKPENSLTGQGMYQLETKEEG